MKFIHCIMLIFPISALKMMSFQGSVMNAAIPNALFVDSSVPPNSPTNLFIGNPKLNPNWYVIGEADKIKPDIPHKVSIYDTPIAIWKDKANQYGAISDVCPHRGASLSNGRIDKDTGCIVCPYHTFKYNKCGRMVQAPGQANMRLNDNYSFKTDVPHYPIAEKDGWVFLLNKPLYDIKELKLYGSESIWSEPEANDPEFKRVYLNKMFNQDARTVTENSLDILHISEVHTFGNKKRPLPLSDKLDKVGEGHWKAVYQYEAGEDSIPVKIFGIKTLIVENEFILPHTTVARVKFGSFVNTIITSALPITNNESILHVKAYRNNWVFNNPILDAFFDYQTRRMMEKTLCEDKGVIDTIYPKYRDGNFITKYDNLVKIYRDEYASMVDKDPAL